MKYTTQMWLHNTIVKPLCRPPESLKGTPLFTEQKYTNYCNVYGLGFAAVSALISLAFFNARPARAITQALINLTLVYFVWRKWYSAVRLSTAFLTYWMTISYYNNPDHFEFYFAPILGLTMLLVYGTSKTTLTMFFVCMLIFAWFFKQKMEIFIQTTSKEDIAAAAGRSFTAMIRIFGTIFFHFIGKVIVQEKTQRKWISLKKKIASQNEELKKANEELNNALEEKDTFILSFSHETRNPLNGLLGNLHLLSEMSLPKQASQILAKALVCSKILKNIVLTILDSRKTGHSTSDMQLAQTPANMKVFIEEISILCRDLIRGKGLTPIIEISHGFPQNLTIDPERLSQVVFNFVSNAIKFTEKGFIRLSFGWISNQHRQVDTHFMTAIDTKVSLKLREDFIQYDENCFRKLQTEEDGVFAISVQDTGVGIKKEQQQMIFDKFAQAGTSDQLKKLGLGLGLWISKVIVSLHKGEIFVSSEEGKGSCFTAVIPTKASASVDAPVSRVITESIPAEKIDTASSKKPKMRALVVEDFPINQIINADMLKKFGIEEVIIASNGKEGVDIFKEKGPNYFDVITVDLEMPVMKGKDAIIKIREFEARKNIPPTKIIIISGNAIEKEMQDCTNCNGDIRADAFLAKPCDYMRLSKTLNTLGIGTSKKLNTQVKKALFVDDDFFNLDILGGYATSMGLEYITARNGKEGVEIFKQNFESISVVFLDKEMPILNGLEACKIITEECKLKRIKCPIYLVSGSTTTRSLPEGFDGMIQKPFTFNRFEKIMLSLS